MKKTLLSLAATLCVVVSAKAQTSYGLKAGLNFAKVKTTKSNTSFTTDAATTFYVTGYADLPVSNNLSVQPGISLQGKGGAISEAYTDEKTKENLMYIEVPVNFVYSIPTGNTGNIFLGVGPYAGFGIHTKTTQGNFSESRSFSDAGLKNFNAGLNFLTGFKFANGFLINGGYDLGLTNIVKDSGGASAKNRVFSVGVGFQF
ncbi:hypothetical protein D3C87_1418290 [compost metagenome]